LQHPVRGKKDVLRYVERDIGIAHHPPHVPRELHLVLAHEGLDPDVCGLCFGGVEVDLLHSWAPLCQVTPEFGGL
jgi:hypothetical protein